MFTRCLFCHVPFPGNDVLEHFRTGRKVAYDPARGRLWAICTTCRRWTLAPIHERWEALEELERLVTDRARLLASTDHISLYREGPLDAVRVGGADTAEEAWWRYGEGLVARRRRYIRNAAILGVAGVAVAAGGVAVGGSALFGLHAFNLGRMFVELGGQRRRFGSAAWEGEAPCLRCGAVLRQIVWGQEERIILVPDESGDRPFSVHFRCYRCGRAGDAGYRLEGAEAEHFLRRAVAYRNRQGASEGRVKDAAGLIERAGSPRALALRYADQRTQIGELERAQVLALEIAANEDVERRLLELELSELEERWREEEELAAIVDGELTPVPLLERIRAGLGMSPGSPRADREAAG